MNTIRIRGYNINLDLNIITDEKINISLDTLKSRIKSSNPEMIAKYKLFSTYHGNGVVKTKVAWDGLFTEIIENDLIKDYFYDEEKPSKGRAKRNEGGR